MPALSNKDMDKYLVTVTVPPMFRFRVWLGLQLIKLGVRTTGMAVKFERTEDQ